jgi:hypothetical protein
LCNEVVLQRSGRGTALVAALVIASPLALVTSPTSAEGLFDFFFGRAKPQTRRASPPASFFVDPFGNIVQPALLARPVVAGSGLAFCVRSCDGKYFAMMRAAASPAQMCQAFCPASPTTVFSAPALTAPLRRIASAMPIARTPSATARRCALIAPAMGATPAGLAPIDLTLDPSLRPGDVVATTDGLVAYSGVRIGSDQTAEFTPVASYPGLSDDLRARLSEIKVAPARAERAANDAPFLVTPPAAAAAGLNTAPTRDKRADAELLR